MALASRLVVIVGGLGVDHGYISKFRSYLQSQLMNCVVRFIHSDQHHVMLNRIVTLAVHHNTENIVVIAYSMACVPIIYVVDELESKFGYTMKVIMVDPCNLIAQTDLHMNLPKTIAHANVPLKTHNGSKFLNLVYNRPRTLGLLLWVCKSQMLRNIAATSNALIGSTTAIDIAGEKVVNGHILSRAQRVLRYLIDNVALKYSPLDLIKHPYTKRHVIHVLTGNLSEYYNHVMFASSMNPNLSVTIIKNRGHHLLYDVSWRVTNKILLLIG